MIDADAEREGKMKKRSILLRLGVLSQLVLRLLKETCLLPRSVAVAFKERRLQTARDAAEAERLDRIRNPSDYLGK